NSRGCVEYRVIATDLHGGAVKRIHIDPVDFDVDERKRQTWANEVMGDLFQTQTSYLTEIRQEKLDCLKHIRDYGQWAERRAHAVSSEASARLLWRSGACIPAF
ncbi:hypothetical protein KEM55_002847, partial [Ascosphaera atra]